MANEPTVHKPLSTERRKRVEVGLELFQQQAQELDEMRSENENLRVKIREHEVTIDGLDRQIGTLESQLISTRAERDSAISSRAELDAFLSIIKTAVDRAYLPAGERMLRRAPPVDTTRLARDVGGGAEDEGEAS